MKKIRNINRTRNILICSLVVISSTCLWLGLVGTQKSDFNPPSEISFGLWYPSTESSKYKYEQNSLKYDKLSKIVTFNMNDSSGKILTFTEQAVPESSQVPADAFDEQLASIPQDTSFESANGTVSITKPAANDQTTAIMKSRGTLLFVTTENKITTDQWRALFNSMELIQ